MITHVSRLSATDSSKMNFSTDSSEMNLQLICLSIIVVGYLVIA
jgi:hypothetical protein